MSTVVGPDEVIKKDVIQPLDNFVEIQIDDDKDKEDGEDPFFLYKEHQPYLLPCPADR